MSDRTHKRLVGIARSMQRRYRLDYEALPDLIQWCWVFYLERECVEEERRFNQVFCAVHRKVWSEFSWLQGSNREAPEQAMEESDRMEARVLLQQIVQKCKRSDENPSLPPQKRTQHLKTLQLIFDGVIGRGAYGRKVRKTVKDRRTRLRRFLEASELAA